MVLDTKTSEVTFEVQGIEGTKCTEITEALTLGSEVQDEGFTAEYCMEESPDYVEDQDD